MKLKPHPLAELFPEATKEEEAALVKDIRQYGLLEIITIYEGMILDGRTRYRACLKAGREPRYCDFTDHLPERQREGPLAYVLSRNLHRRHMNTSQRALIAEKVANIERGQVGGGHNGQNGKSADLVKQSKAAETLNVSERTLRVAKKVKREAPPEIIEAVQNGTMTLHAALKEIAPGSKIKLSKKEIVFPTDSISKLITLAQRNRHKFICHIGSYRIRVTRTH